MFTLLMVVFFWFGSGLFGFIFWWTIEHDLCLDIYEFRDMFFAACIGPFAWLLGWHIHGDHSGDPIVLIKQRKKKTNG